MIDSFHAQDQELDLVHRRTKYTTHTVKTCPSKYHPDGRKMSAKHPYTAPTPTISARRGRRQNECPNAKPQTHNRI